MIEAADKKKSIKNGSITSKESPNKKFVPINKPKRENSNVPSQTISQKTLNESQKVVKIPQNARVPKLEPELCPIYSEILTDIYEHPILVTILVAANAPVPSSATYKEWDPLNLLGIFITIDYLHYYYYHHLNRR